jgi:hypothetical protein
MITLKTLAQASAQEVFDQVVTHLLTQKKRSEGKNEDGDLKCVYRNDDLKCAAGCLIADDEYVDKMDHPDYVTGIGTSWLSLVERGLVPSTKHNNLITSLQKIHDSVFVIEWERELIRMAQTEGLSFNYKCKEV